MHLQGDMQQWAFSVPWAGMVPGEEEQELTVLSSNSREHPFIFAPVY